jgi:hypothetical protein
VIKKEGFAADRPYECALGSTFGKSDRSGVGTSQGLAVTRETSNVCVHPEKERERMECSLLNIEGLSAEIENLMRPTSSKSAPKRQHGWPVRLNAHFLNTLSTTQSLGCSFFRSSASRVFSRI